LRYQKTEYHCGPAAVQNALAVIGIKVSQDRLAAAAGTTEEHGTDQEGIKRAIISAGRSFDEHATDTERVAHGWLWYSLMVGRPVVLCVDRWAHWVVAVGVLGKRAVLFDPARYRHNTDRLGTFTLPKDRLLKRWKAAHRVAGSEPAYYGIAVGGPR
jgi:predicted double-glycine peptidase